MASSAERLYFYRLYYHGLSAAQSQIPPAELQSREARLRQAELRMLEELIMLFANITPNPTTITLSNDESMDKERPAVDMESLDVSLVTDILLLSPPSPWVLYMVMWSATEWQLCYVSPSLKRLLGWRPSDVLGKPIWEGCHQEDVPKLQQIFHPKGTTAFSASAKSHAFGEFVTLRRLRRDQSVATMYGTGIAIGSRWYAWMEQDTSALKLAHLGCSAAGSITSNWPLTNPENVPEMNAKIPSKRGFQPPTIVVERAAVSKPETGNYKGFRTPTIVVEEGVGESQMEGGNHMKGFQPPTIVVEERAAVLKSETRNYRKGFQTPIIVVEEGVGESQLERGNHTKGFQPPTIVVEERVVECKPETGTHRKVFQPPTIMVEERGVDTKPMEGNHRKGAMKEIKNTPVTKPSSPPSTGRSQEIKTQKATVGHSSRHSSVESLPAHMDMSPRLLPNHARKFNDVNNKGLDFMRGKSALLVDDSNTYLKGGQALLARMGCHVFVAHNGEEALQMMQHVSPTADLPPQFDMVFMDLSMPKMDGIQAVKLFRNWEGNQQSGRVHTVIIAVTANDTDGDMVLCAQTGFDGFVTKPINKTKILDCLAASQVNQ